MSNKEIKEETKKIEGYEAKIKELTENIKNCSFKEAEATITKIHVLQHKINVAEERIERPTVTVNRIFCKAGDGFFKR